MNRKQLLKALPPADPKCVWYNDVSKVIIYWVDKRYRRMDYIQHRILSFKTKITFIVSKTNIAL